jgi:hypothetical protein
MSLRDSQPKKPRKQRTVKQRSAKQRWLLRISYIGYVVLLLYGGVRLFFWIRYERGSRGPVTSVERVWRHHYRELWDDKLFDVNPSLTDDRYDVLLLGGSVAEQTAAELRTELQAHTSLKVRVHCVARAAHNSRDSAIKFDRLDDKEFDCVIVYNGINDVPMNYIADSEYRDDYTHCGWYESFQRRLKTGRISITEISSDLVTIGRQPEQAKMKFGDKIKTGNAFRSNLESITSRAQKNGSTVILMSFASYIPTDYSMARFRAGELDYTVGQYDMPVETWGRPKDIPRILSVQNRVAETLAKRHKTVWVDQSQLLQGKTYFCDVCHLSQAGCEQFARNTVAALRAQTNFK